MSTTAANPAVVVGHVHGAAAGLRETDGDLPATASAYAEAARRAMNVDERDNVLIVVDHLEAAKAFFAELGMELEGETQVEGVGWIPSSSLTAEAPTSR